MNLKLFYILDYKRKYICVCVCERVEIYIYIHTHTHIYTCIYLHTYTWASQVVLVVKNPPANAGDIRDMDLIPWRVRKSPGEGHGNPLQYSGLENPMDRGA